MTPDDFEKMVREAEQELRDKLAIARATGERHEALIPKKTAGISIPYTDDQFGRLP